MPTSNTPVTNVAGAAVACNVNGATGVQGKCSAKVGSTVTVEMHQVREPSPQPVPHEGGDSLARLRGGEKSRQVAVPLTPSSWADHLGSVLGLLG